MTGEELTARALTQAKKSAPSDGWLEPRRNLSCARKPYVVRMGDGPGVPARTVIIATGADTGSHDRQPVALRRRRRVLQRDPDGTHLCEDDEVVVVGGGNSAGQAAMFLSQTGEARAHAGAMENLSSSMSRYLIRRIEESPSSR